MRPWCQKSMQPEAKSCELSCKIVLFSSTYLYIRDTSKDELRTRFDHLLASGAQCGLQKQWGSVCRSHPTVATWPMRRASYKCLTVLLKSCEGPDGIARWTSQNSKRLVCLEGVQNQDEKHTHGLSELLASDTSSRLQSEELLPWEESRSTYQRRRALPFASAGEASVGAEWLAGRCAASLCLPLWPANQMAWLHSIDKQHVQTVLCSRRRLRGALPTSYVVFLSVSLNFAPALYYLCQKLCCYTLVHDLLSPIIICTPHIWR